MMTHWKQRSPSCPTAAVVLTSLKTLCVTLPTLPFNSLVHLRSNDASAWESFDLIPAEEKRFESARARQARAHLCCRRHVRHACALRFGSRSGLARPAAREPDVGDAPRHHLNRDADNTCGARKAQLSHRSTSAMASNTMASFARCCAMMRDVLKLLAGAYTARPHRTGPRRARLNLHCGGARHPSCFTVLCWPMRLERV